MDFKAGGSTRMQLAMSAAGTALQAFPDNARVGLWLLSIDLGDGTDHRELVPLRRLDKSVGSDTQRDTLRSWLAKALDLTSSEEHTSELQSLMRTSYAVLCLRKKPTPRLSHPHGAVPSPLSHSGIPLHALLLA